MAQPIQYQGMPLMNVPVMNLDGTMNIIWYRFFQSLWHRAGLNTAEIGVARPNLFAGGGDEYVYPVLCATPKGYGGSPVVAMFQQDTGTFLGIFGYTP